MDLLEIIVADAINQMFHALFHIQAYGAEERET
jgi:hypothetical protein